MELLKNFLGVGRIVEALKRTAESLSVAGKRKCPHRTRDANGRWPGVPRRAYEASGWRSIGEHDRQVRIEMVRSGSKAGRYSAQNTARRLLA